MTKRKNILFIVSRLPIHTQTGDRVRVYNFIKKLTERGHEVDILGFVPDQDYKASTDIQKITHQCIGIKKEGLEFTNPSRGRQLQQFFTSFFKSYPYRVWQWYDQNFIDQARELIMCHNYDVVHFSEVSMGILVTQLNKELKEVRIVFDMIDSVALSLENALKQEINLLWLFRFVEKIRLKKFEKRMVKTVDQAILIAKRDKDFLGFKSIEIIPNGIDENDLQERTRDIDLLFTGNMAAEANIDAVRWFVHEIFPKLLATNPRLHFTIAGANPPVSIKQLQSKNITVTGFVQVMNAYYRRAKLFVCPIRLGAGQKNKILEAMINHCPVISTTEGNMGIDAPSGAIAIANDEDAFNKTIVSLLNRQEDRNQLAENGYTYAKKTFSWETSVDLLEQCYEA